jgi:serralysin
VVGDSVQIYNGTTVLGTATTLTSTNITNGFVDITTSVLSQGAYTLNAKVIDIAGNASSASSNFNTAVDIAAPILSTTSYNVAENLTTITTLLASDAGAITYSLGGTGVDNSKFSITSSGALTFLTAKDFETPGSVAGSNTYAVTINITDVAGNTINQAVAITVTNINEAPVITSGATANFAENGTGTAYTVAATDVDAGTTLAYSLSGTDSGLFNINSTTGAVTFKSSPNFESPTDSGVNNVYDINVIASDGSLTTTKAVAITVTNVNEVPVISSGLLTTSVFEVADAAATSSTAYSLLAGQIAEGTISQAGDHDGYKVYLTGGVTYSFAMTGSGSDNLKDTYLRLYNSTGTLVASDDDGLPGSNSIFTYTPGSSSSGYFYIDAAGVLALVKTDQYSEIGKYSLTFSEGQKPSFSISMGAGVIDSDLSWSTHGTSANISYGFRQTQSVAKLGNSNVGTIDCKLTAAQIDAVRASLTFWSDVCGLSFTEVNPGGYTNSATILIGNYSDSNDGGGAFAYKPGTSPNTSSGSSEGDLWLNLGGGISTTNLAFGTYSAHTIIHELGHAIGLNHPGIYNAASGVSITYSANAQFIQDTDQYSVMTYFYGPPGGVFADPLRSTTPMMFDILAAQNIYGVNNTTRATDTIYGFNSTAGSAYLFSGSAATSAFCIWDGNGTDTIDVSGFANSQLINLGSGTFSDVGGLTYNVSIAVGCAIENAKGGSGKDVIFGNALNNVLTGGAGNDLIFGGAGSDTAIFSGAKSQYVISQITDGWSVVGADGTDWLFNMEFAQFSDQTTTLLSNASYNITSYVKASIAENATGTVYTAAATDVDSTSLTYVLGGLDAGLFNISSSGAVTFKTAQNYEVPSDLGSDNNYNITVRAFDGTNYSDAQEVAITVTNVAEAGDAVISLGSGMGQLIAPVQVDGGKWFYFWDINGDGVSSVVDLVNHNFLDTYFKYDSSNNINSIYGNVDGQFGSTFLHRFATINGVSLALPNAGGLLGAPFGLNGIGSYQQGTGISLNSTNTTYDDLLAIWDAYNGNAGTSSSSSKFNGTPAGWQPYSYWSATPSTQGHATTELSSGGVFNSLDTQNWFVALQVL